MLKIYSLVRGRRLLFIAGTASGLVSGLLTAQVIAYIRDGLESTAFVDSAFLVKMIVTSFLAVNAGILSAYFLSKITAIIIRELTKSLSEKILRAQFEYIESVSDRIVPVMTRDITMISEFINKTPQFIVASTAVVATLVKMFLIDWELTAYFFIVFSLQALLLIATLPFIKRFSLRNVKHNNALYEALYNMVLGLKELSLNKARRHNYMKEVIGEELKHMNDARIKGKVTDATAERLTDFLIFIFSGIFMFTAIHYLHLDFERFKVFLPIVLFILPYFGKISSYLRNIKVTEASLEQIQSLGYEIDQYQVTMDKQVPIPMTTGNKNLISFNEVTYTYAVPIHERQLSFGPLSLDIDRQKITFIIGGNGSGKTTFAKLLTGLYLPKTGTVKVYPDVFVNSSNVLSYRDLFSAYFADSFTFEHLSHVDEEYMEENSAKFLEMLQMQDKVQITSGKFSTKKLSFGQKSRLSLIGNMLDNKKIYVFDEWAANQDPYFKAIFYSQLLPYLKQIGKTIVVITHDEKYFHHADEIIELKEGMVV